MKTLINVLVGIAVWIALGQVLPVSQSTALVITALGSLGAISYAGLAGMTAFALMTQRKA